MFTLPQLPYAFDALEPAIDARTMEIHYGKHHAAYVNKLNKAVEEAGGPFAEFGLERLLTNLAELPETVRTAIRNNGGGHYNHSLFWKIMGPQGGGQPTGELATRIEGTFGSFASFQERFHNAAATRFGSGWAWLLLNGQGELEVTSSPNQDNPLLEGRGKPILGLDVWEHAYYLKYQNRRPEYIEAWWNTVNWDEVTRLYNDLKS